MLHHENLLQSSVVGSGSGVMSSSPEMERTAGENVGTNPSK